VPTSFSVHSLLAKTGLSTPAPTIFRDAFNPTVSGEWKFESLADRLPEAHAALTRARSIIAHPDGIFIGSHEGVIRWHADAVAVFNLGSGGNELSRAGNTLVNRRPVQGVWRWNGKDWSLGAEPGPLDSEELGTLIEGPAPGSALFACSGQGVFLIDANGKISPWTDAVNDAAKDAVFYCGLKLHDGRYLFGTID
jgi:hypothetical protein